MLYMRDIVSTDRPRTMVFEFSSRIMKSLQVQLCRALIFRLSSQMRNSGNCASATSWKYNLIYKTTVPLAQRLLIKGSCPSSWADRPASKVFGKKSAAVLSYSAWATKRCRTSDPNRCRTSLCSHTVSDHPAVAVLEQYSILERKKRRHFSSTAHGRMGLWPFTLTFSAKVALCVSGS